MSTTTRIVKGFVDSRKDNNFSAFTTQADHHQFKRPAILIYNDDDTVPEVMTMDQVRAMLADLKDQTMSMAVEQSIDRIAAKRGITL